MTQILLIGDSISEGYTPVVKNLLTDHAEVHRPNQNCGSTKIGLEKLDSWLGETPWDIIHFNWGLHDLRYVDENGEFAEIPRGRHFVTLPEYRQNLHRLVARLKQTGAKLIWCSSTPVPAGCSWRLEADEERFNAVAAEVMAEEGIPVNDLHQAVKGQLSEFQEPNDVHFNEQGSVFLGQQVSQAIRRLIP